MKGRKTEEKEEVLAWSEKLPRKMKGTRKEGGEEAVVRVERNWEKTKGGKTEEKKKTAVGRTEELPRKMAWLIKEGSKKAVAGIPMKMKGQKTEDKKEALERLKIER